MKSFKSPRRLGFFAMLAAVLGITSGCKGNGGGGDDVICMYGVPTVSYELKGKVTDEAGKPLEGIEVSFERLSGTDSAAVGNALGPRVATDAAGAWSASVQDDPAPILRVTFRDVDGPENGGLFAEESAVLKDIEPVKDPKDTKNPWDLGEVKKEMPAVKMAREQ